METIDLIIPGSWVSPASPSLRESGNAMVRPSMFREGFVRGTGAAVLVAATVLVTPAPAVARAARADGDITGDGRAEVVVSSTNERVDDVVRGQVVGLVGTGTFLSGLRPGRTAATASRRPAH